ncbi:MAG: hypothetical protein LIO97_08035 [Tannerellaceae bacterium]|nr:hypothetical protein [Tannerellaceae bacterium]
METENNGFAGKLFSGLQGIAEKALGETLDEAETFIGKWKNLPGLTPEVATGISKIEGIVQQVRNTSFDIPGAFGFAASALGDCVSVAAMFDAELADALETAAGLAEGAFDIGSGVARIFSGDIVGGTMSALKGGLKIVSTIKGRLEENKRIRQEYLTLAEKTHEKEMQYNAVLREHLRLQQQIGETTLKYSERLSKELEKQQVDITKEYNDVWNKLMGEEYISDTKYKHGTWFRKAKITNVYSGLAGKSYEDIEKLYATNKLSDSAKELFECLRELKEEGANVAEMMANLQEEMKQVWTGTTASFITDSIVQGFLDGKRSAEDFADDFEEMMKKAMMQSIKLKYIEGPIMDWYDKFAEASEVGLTEERIEALRRQYNQILEDAAGHIENMELITGIGVGNALGDAVEETATNENTLRGAYAKASQKSIDLLAGQTGALRVTVDNIHNNMVNLYSLQEQG